MKTTRLFNLLMLFTVLFGTVNAQNLKVDFGSDVSPVHADYEGYKTINMDTSSLTRETYSAFSTNVTLRASYAPGIIESGSRTVVRTETVDEPDLLQDWLSVDVRNDQGDSLILIIGGLPAGKYNWLSYHHDAQNQRGTFVTDIYDANGTRRTDTVTVTNGPLTLAAIAKLETTIESDGTDSVQIILDIVADEPFDATYAFALINAFEISPYVASSEKEITAFSVAEQIGNAVIDTTHHTVTLEVTFGTDLTALTPDITVSDSAKISPASGVEQDFTNPLVYTVTAEDKSTQEWTVTISEKAARTGKDILTFEITGINATETINSNDKTVSIVCPGGTDLKSLTPKITVSPGATVSPASDSVQDFSSAVVYKVTAEDKTTQNWTVTASLTSSTKDITDSDIQIYPNPASSLFTIKGVDVKKVKVFDTVGRLVLEASNTAEISVGELTKGAYTVLVTNLEGEIFGTQLLIK